MDVVFRERSDTPQIEAVPLSHLSIEVGHLYREDLEDSDERLREQFSRAAPWIETATRTVTSRHGSRARVSTCFLVDDYTPAGSRRKPAGPPAQVLNLLVETARSQGFTLDYIVRESGCARSADRPGTDQADLVELADIVAGMLVAEPDEGDNGSRPPTADLGWLANGLRTPEIDASAAMAPASWQPPEEYGRRNHSVFLDVELWAKVEDWTTGEPLLQRDYSCAFLAAVWQLMRLGMLRNEGKSVARPYKYGADQALLPTEWLELPTVLQVNDRAAPFSAYRAFSLLPHWYLPTEHAVRHILDHLSLDQATAGQIAERAEKERISLPGTLTERLGYVFLDE